MAVFVELILWHFKIPNFSLKFPSRKNHRVYVSTNIFSSRHRTRRSFPLFSSNYSRTSRFAVFICGLPIARHDQQVTEEMRGKKSARYVALRCRSYVSPIILHVRRNS